MTSVVHPPSPDHLAWPKKHRARSSPGPGFATAPMSQLKYAIAPQHPHQLSRPMPSHRGAPPPLAPKRAGYSQTPAPPPLPTMPFSKRYRWTAEEDSELLELCKQYSINEVSLICGRTVSAVSQRRRTLLQNARRNKDASPKGKTRARTGSLQSNESSSSASPSKSTAEPLSPRSEMSISPPTTTTTLQAPKLPSFASFEKAVLSDAQYPPPPPIEFLARVSPQIVDTARLAPAPEEMSHPRRHSLPSHSGPGAATQDAVRDELRMTLTRIVGASHVGLSKDEEEDLYVVQNAAGRMLEKLWRTSRNQ